MPRIVSEEELKKAYSVNSTSELDEGTPIVIVDNSNENDYTLYGEYRVHNIEDPEGFIAKDPENGAIGNFVVVRDIYILPLTHEKLEETKKNNEEKIKALQEENQILEDKQKFMEQYNIEILDDEEYSVYRLLDISTDKEKTREEKIDLIKSILSNKDTSN